MIICVNDKEIIDGNSFVSDYGNFIIEFSNGHKFLYQRVAFDSDSYKFKVNGFVDMKDIAYILLQKSTKYS